MAIIENKLPEKFNTREKKKNAILQEIEVAEKLQTKLIIATDGQETLWINVETRKSVEDERGNELKSHFDYKDPNLQKFIRKILHSINEKNNRILRGEVVDPTNLAKRIWQDVWSVSGATPENCLYTFVELFIFKYLSDLGILEQGFDFNHLWERYSYKIENPKKKALEYYANTIRPEIKKLFPENLDDKTTIINGTIFVSKDQKAVNGYSTVFKKVLERFKDYGKLENINYDFKSKLFESFLKESISKKNWGQFFTPIRVVRAINKMAKDEWKEDMKICDPACGVGKFPLEFIKNKIDKLFVIEEGKITSKVKIIGFDRGFDKDEQKTIILAKANMLIYFSELIRNNVELTEEFAKIFNNSFILKTDSILGTLAETTKHKNKYDLILTNPPYAMSGSSNLKQEIAKNQNLKDYYKVNAMGVEGLFVEWIVRSLKPNGKGFVVVPDGILNRKNDRKLRQFILDNCYVDAIISLPENTFFTTPKKTYILAITKKSNISEKQTDPVFTYLVSEIGESRDIYRFSIEQDDLNEAVVLFQFFKGNKKHFEKILENRDKRCKIQPIEKFKLDSNWLVDRWWKREELVEIGIIKERSAINLGTFSEIIENISDKLRNFSKLIKEINKEKNKLPNNFGEILLSDVFEIKKGNDKYTNEFINKNPGEYPVYSSQTTNDGVMGKINCYDYDCEALTWTTDGIHAGTVFVRKGKFSMTTHCGALIPKNKNQALLPDYVYWNLSENLKEYALGDQNKRLTINVIKKVKVKVPVTEGGSFDLKKQKEITEKHQSIKELRNMVKTDKQEISKLVVNIENNLEINKQGIIIGEIFDLSIGTNGSGKLTKTFIDKNRGDIPVYGASKDEDNNNYGKVKDNLIGIKYFENCLTWNRNGSIGKVFLRKGRFSLSTDVIPLIIREKYKNSVNLLYLKYAMERELVKQGFDFSNKAGKDKIKNVEIKIPITPQGHFDSVKQKEIAKEYQQIEAIKEKITKELEKIEDIKTDIGIES